MRCLFFVLLPLACVAACTFPSVTYMPDGGSAPDSGPPTPDGGCPDCLTGAQTCTDNADSQRHDCSQHCQQGQQGCMTMCNQAFDMARTTCATTCEACSLMVGCTDAGSACVAAVYGQ